MPPQQYVKHNDLLDLQYLDYHSKELQDPQPPTLQHMNFQTVFTQKAKRSGLSRPRRISYYRRERVEKGTGSGGARPVQLAPENPGA